MNPPAQTLAAIDTVIFDVGGVLAATGRHSDFARRFPPEHAEQVTRIFVGNYGQDGDHPWHRLERGEITLEENRRLAGIALAEAGIELPAPPPGGAPMIVFTASEPMVELVKELRDSGIRLGVLTNNVLEFRDNWRSMMPFDDWFDDIVDSHEVGLRKPNPAIYQLALARLGAEAGRTAFLDDVPTNVSAAESVGIRGVLVDEDPTEAIATTRRL
ncbi:MAG: HAD family phosphatase, partial [Ilumatobacteraceae bacterium]|nr:HAD family phosphatase [Ilumatobacteraceae bacterium]